MKSGQVLRAAFKAHGFKAVAQETGLSLSCIYKWCEPDGGKASGALNPLERTAQLVALTGDEGLLDWLCAQRGGRFVRRSELPALARKYKELLLAEVGQFFQAMVKPLRASLRSPAETPDGTHGQAGGARCRFRLAGHRCGFPHAARN